MPLSSKAKPACIKKTRTDAKTTQRVFNFNARFGSLEKAGIDKKVKLKKNITFIGWSLIKPLLSSMKVMAANIMPLSMLVVYLVIRH